MTTIRIDLRRHELAGAALPAPPAAFAPPVAPEVAIAWTRCTGAWDDPASHDAVVGLAARHRALGWVATRYRERGGDPIAARQLERVCRAAMVVALTATPRAQPEASGVPKLVWWVAVCTFVMIGAVAGARVVIGRAAPAPAQAAHP